MTSAPPRSPDGGDSEVVALARGSALTFVGAIVTQLGSVAVLALLAQSLPQRDVGLYQQAFALFSILQVLALFGFGQALTRFVAVHRADRDTGRLHGTVRVGLIFTGCASLVVAAVVFALSGWVANSVYDEPDLAMPLRYAALALPPSVITAAALAATQGFRTMKPLAGVGLILDPLMRVVLTSLVLAAGWGLEGVMEVFVLTPLVTAVASVVWLFRLLGGPTEAPVYDVPPLVRFSRTSWVANSAAQALLWADSLILPLYVPPSQLAVYGVATRLVVLASFTMTPINQSFAPRIADLTRRKLRIPLQRTYVAAAGWMLRFSLPFFAVIWLFPKNLLLLFGAGYVSGAAVTMILSVGKVTDVATGPCGVMLNQAGFNRVSMIDNIAALVINVALCFVLIPRYGIEGAAIAWAVALVMVNLLRVTQVYRLIARVLPIGVGSPRAIAAAAAAVLAALLVRESITVSSFGELVIGTTVIFVVYIVVVLALGLPAEDRLVMNDLLRSARKRRAPAAVQVTQ